MKKKYTIEDCQKIANLKGGDCLSKEYIKAIIPMIWQCKEKHIWEAPFNSILNQGHWCWRCSPMAKNVPENCKTFRYTIEFCQKIAKERGGECLSIKYKNCKGKFILEM